MKFTESLLTRIGAQYPLTEIPAGEFSALKVSSIRFSIKAYHAEGLGHVSIMTASGMMGLMQMDTLIVNPTARDLPLYSYDRILAMGNDTLITELYATMLEEKPLPALAEVKNAFSHLPERDPGEHWYDSIKLQESISKKTKKKQSADMDALSLAHLEAFLSFPAAAVSDKDLARKQTLAAAYVDGLLEKGGPSTDVFVKKLGKETTARLFREILFGTVQ